MPDAVIVTGASSGLGAVFARRFAARGQHLVLIARRATRLRALAAELEREHGVRADVLPVDLAAPGAAAEIAEQLAARGIRAAGLVNAAGFGTADAFADEDPERLADEIQVNVTALALLTRALLPQLIEARGTLINISSIAGHQPLPGLAAYAATKAFVTSLTESIWFETRGSGLRVLALCPGPTATEFFDTAGSDRFKVGRVAAAETVVDTALAALDGTLRGPVLTIGTGNAVQGWAGRVAPRRLRLRIASRRVGASR